MLMSATQAAGFICTITTAIFVLVLTIAIYSI